VTGRLVHVDGKPDSNISTSRASGRSHLTVVGLGAEAMEWTPHADAASSSGRTGYVRPASDPAGLEYYLHLRLQDRRAPRRLVRTTPASDLPIENWAAIEHGRGPPEFVCQRRLLYCPYINSSANSTHRYSPS
jgi:hypothetical protein